LSTVFTSFHIMVGLGLVFIVVSWWAGVQLLRGRLDVSDGLLRLFVAWYAGLLISMWPLAVPPDHGFHEAASLPATQLFCFSGHCCFCRSFSATRPGPIGCSAAR